MWRIYSHDKGSVRIKTSFLKMIQVLNQTRGMPFVYAYFGKVDYKDRESLLEWMNQRLLGGSGVFIKSIIDSLFIKRLEFIHENEVRFIISNNKSESTKAYDNIYDDHIDMKVDPFNFIEEITLDPRLNDEEFEESKNNLSKIAKDIPIHKSDLYSFNSRNRNIPQTPLYIEAIVHEKQ